jgi:RNA polymerase sigma-70 factor (sigma-E family)
VEVLVRVEAGFAGFVREHTSALLRMAYLLTGNRTAAEELVQDTLVRLYPKWERVEAAEAPLAYVRRALANGFINHQRRAARREYAYADVPEHADHRDALGQLHDRDEIWAGLLTLPERQRAALVLRFFEDLSDEESAAALGCRVGTIRSLVSRGLSALREQMGQPLPPAAGRIR